MCDWAGQDETDACFDDASHRRFGDGQVSLCAKHWLEHRKNHTEVGAKAEPSPAEPYPAALDFAEFVRRWKELPPDKQQDVAMWIQTGEWWIQAEGGDIC